jgi:hypothetical protein
MKALVLVMATMVPASAIADTCINMEGPTLINGCQSCVELTVRALRPRQEQAAGLLTGESRTIRLDPGGRERLQGSDRWAVTGFRLCH